MKPEFRKTKTLEEVKRFIEEIKVRTAADPDCKDCLVQQFNLSDPETAWPEIFEMPPDRLQAFVIMLTEKAEADGWEPLVDRAGYRRRCEPCRTRLRYPWAGKLDAEKVLAFLKTQESVFLIDELKSLV